MIGKKGLSTVVTTLIIVLLVLAAIGIIWNPIKNLLTQSQTDFDKTKCLKMEVSATGVVNELTVNGSYTVTLSRRLTGEDEIGAKLIFFADNTASAAIDFGPTLTVDQPIMSRYVTSNMDPFTVGNATKVRVTPYYIDEATNEEKLCDSYTEFTFT